MHTTLDEKLNRVLKYSKASAILWAAAERNASRTSAALTFESKRENGRRIFPACRESRNDFTLCTFVTGRVQKAGGKSPDN